MGTPYWDEEEQALAGEDDDDDGEYDIKVLSSTEDPRLQWLSNFKVATEIPPCYNQNEPK